MKYYARLPLLLLPMLCLLASCECERYACPGFNSGATWVPNSDFKYRDAASPSEITFAMTGHQVSSYYGKDETTLSFSCNQNDCMATADIKASAAATAGTPAISLQFYLTDYYNGKKFSHTELRYALNDMEGTLKVRPSLIPSHPFATDDWYADSISDVNTGLEVYPHVLIQTRKIAAGDKAVVRTYWYDNGKLIGFALSNGATYWLK